MRLFTTIAIFVIAIITIYLLIKSYTKQPFKNEVSSYSQIEKLIPQNASLILISNNVYELNKLLNERDNYFAFFKTFKEYNDFKKSIEFITKIFSNIYHPDKKKPIKIDLLILSLYQLSKKDLLPLIIISLNCENSFYCIKKIYKNNFLFSVTNKYTYFDKEIYTFYNNNFKSGFYVLFKDNKIIISPSNLLLEEVIRLENSEIESNEYKQIFNLINKSSFLSIVVNHSEIKSLLLNWFKKSNFINSIIEITFAKWSIFDFHLSKDELNLYGYTDVSDTLYYYFSALQGKGSFDKNFTNIIPNNVNFLLYIYIENFKKFFQRRLNILDNFDLKSKICFVNKFKENFFDFIIENNFNEFILATKLNINTKNFLYGYLIIKLKENALKKFSEQFINNQENKNFIKIHTLKISDKEKHTIYEIKYENLGELLVGNFFGLIQANYFVFYNNYLVLSNTMDEIISFLKFNSQKRTINNSKYFKSLIEKIDPKNNIVAIVDNRQLLNVIPHFFNNKKYFFNIINEISLFDAILITSSYEDKFAFNNIKFCFNLPNEKEYISIWELKLDTISNFTPIILQNEKNKEIEIIVQDLFNNVYFINKNGFINSKFSVKNPILSNIYPINLDKNEKTFYVFNTNEKIYFVDKDGYNLKFSPIKLKSNTNLPLLYLDHNNIKQNKIIVFCNDRKVYCYNLQGNLLKDFSNISFKNEILGYKLLKYKDLKYLALFDTMNFYILNIKNKKLITIENLSIFSKNSNIYFDFDNKTNLPYFYINDIFGNVIKVSHDKKVEIIKIYDHPKNLYFYYYDINNNKSKDFIFIDDNKIEIFNWQGKKLFTIKLKNPPIFKPILYNFYDKIILGYVSKKEINFYDLKNNKEIKSINLPSTSNFLLTKNFRKNKLNLITCNNDGFLINFEL